MSQVDEVCVAAAMVLASRMKVQPALFFTLPGLRAATQRPSDEPEVVVLADVAQRASSSSAAAQPPARDRLASGSGAPASSTGAQCLLV